MSKIGRGLRQAERKLDQMGRPAWIATMVAGFILFWPIGLALLGYMMWSGRMGCDGRRRSRVGASAGTGNSAFDAYREATLRRLEEEQEAFQAFLDRLRKARDKAEFDQFVEEKRRGASDGEPVPA